MGKLKFFDNGNTYKFYFTTLIGLLGSIGSYFSNILHPDKININMWVLLPLLIAQTWGKRYGFLSYILYATFLIFIKGNNNYFKIFHALSLLSWIIVHGTDVDNELTDKKYITNKYVIQFCYSIIYTLFYFIFINLVSRYILCSKLFIKFDLDMFLKNVVNVIEYEFVLLAICDVLLIMPIIRRLFRLRIPKETKYNTMIVLFTAISGILLYFYYVLFENHYDFHWMIHPSSRITRNFILVGLLFVIIGGILARIYQKYKASNAKYKLLFNNMVAGYFVIEPIFSHKNKLIDIRFITVNSTSEQLFNKKSKEVVGRTWMQVFDSPNGYLENFEKVFQTGKPQLFEAYYPKLDQYFIISAFTITDNQVGVMFLNITQRVKIEQNTKLEQIVAERTAELTKAYRELEAFNYTVAHDLKSPLKAIDAYIEIIQEDFSYQMEDNMKDMMNKIMKITKDTVTLINKLLQYSTTVGRVLHKEAIDVKEMFATSFHELTTIIPERKIILIYETELPQIMADTIMLKQVIDNIITNAIKFTNTRKSAILQVGHILGQDEIIFYLKDNGIGLSMEQADKLFHIFQRLHPASEYEGNGIGLATVRKIIQIHGGRTWMEGYIDKGATIYFTLPLTEEKD
jgi:signal transduction histidine kinase